MKQETLKEAVERLGLNESTGTLKEVFESGAKWQQERMYSEEEVLELLKYSRDNIPNNVYVVDWFDDLKRNRYERKNN